MFIPVNLEGNSLASVKIACEHNVKNALAAIAVASAFSIPFDNIKLALEKFEPVTKRLLKLEGLNGSTILDDSYSAIPDAVVAALNVLARIKGETIFVFGGMAELNPDQKITAHQHIGHLAKELNIQQLLAVGDLTQHTVKSFGAGARHFETKNDLIDYLKAQLDTHVTVLIKGSRSMQLETIVKTLVTP